MDVHTLVGKWKALLPAVAGLVTEGALAGDGGGIVNIDAGLQLAEPSVLGLVAVAVVAGIIVTRGRRGK